MACATTACRPLLSHVYELGLIEAEALGQTECFEAAVQFARTEGIVPAPEPTHALAAAIDEAKRVQETGEEKVILTALCGHGHLDMAAYDAYFGRARGPRLPGREGSPTRWPASPSSSEFVPPPARPNTCRPVVETRGFRGGAARVAGLTPPRPPDVQD